MRAQSLEEQCKHVSTQFLQLRSKRYLLCLGSPVFALFPEASLNFKQTNQTSNIFIPLDFISECLFVWHFSHQGWGREGLKKPFFNQPFLFGHPPFPFFLGGAPTEHPCIDNSHPWDSNQKTDSYNCLTKLALRTIWCDHPRPSERKEKERSSCHFASAFLPFIFSDAISRF